MSTPLPSWQTVSKPTVPLTKPPSIADSLTTAIDKIAKDKRGYLELDVTTAATELEFGHRFATHWAVGGFITHDWGGNTGAGVRLKGAW